jgi:hypothetical protein
VALLRSHATTSIRLNLPTLRDQDVALLRASIVDSAGRTMHLATNNVTFKVGRTCCHPLPLAPLLATHCHSRHPLPLSPPTGHWTTGLPFRGVAPAARTAHGHAHTNQPTRFACPQRQVLSGPGFVQGAANGDSHCLQVPTYLPPHVSCNYHNSAKPTCPPYTAARAACSPTTPRGTVHTTDSCAA